MNKNQNSFIDESVWLINGGASGHKVFYFITIDDTQNPEEAYYKSNQLEVAVRGNMIEKESLLSRDQDFELFPNHPNPFNSSTKIKFTIPTSSYLSSHQGDRTSEMFLVMLKVYHILGREVTTLVNEEEPAVEYEVEFNVSSGIGDLVSGIYFYQLQAGDLSTGSGQVYLETKKMILMK
ncbi:MAG: hypothetical protein HXY49_07980 [Ignavibacteriaceae bacterium]|nr:hypothetical protein [Ignavibacteriaceae bacterium]